MIVDQYAERRRLNNISKAWAARDNEPWSNDEEDFLIEYWIDVHPKDRDEITVSQCLERTIEACRVRCERIRARLGVSVTVVKTTRVYIGAHDDPDDCYWSPDYYKEEGSHA
jgi:hypothetical protein